MIWGAGWFHIIWMRLEAHLLGSFFVEVLVGILIVAEVGADCIEGRLEDICGQFIWEGSAMWISVPSLHGI